MAEIDDIKMQDPVCGKMVEQTPDAFWADYRGTTYFFDSVKCRDMFDSDPEQYVRERVHGRAL